MEDGDADSSIFHSRLPLLRVLRALRGSTLSRFHAQQVTDEEVSQAALAVGADLAVARAGEDHQVEIFVGFDEGVDDLHGAGWVDVGVQLADEEEELAG